MTKHLGRTLIAGLCLLSTSAFAGIIDFTFTGGDGSLVNSASFNSGGVGVTATAFSIDTNGVAEAGSLWLASTGLGVVNAGNDNSSTVDNGPAGTGWDDYVKFTFNQAVTVTRVSVYPYGDIDISYNTGATTWSTQPADASGAGITTIWLTTTALSDIFRLGASQANGQSNDSFTIAGLRIQTQGSTARAVPEPGTLALLGAGLVGLGLVRRRKHS